MEQVQATQELSFDSIALTTYSWMYHKDGLNLKRRSLALDVYSAIYAYSQGGMGAWVASQSDLAALLQASRQRVCTELNKLIKQGLIYSAFVFTRPTGGKAIKVYKVCLEPINTALKSFPGIPAPMTQAEFVALSAEDAHRELVKEVEDDPTPDPYADVYENENDTHGGENHDDFQEMSFQQSVGQSNVTKSDIQNKTAGKLNVPESDIETDQCHIARHSSPNVPESDIASTSENVSFQQSAYIETRGISKSLSQTKSDYDRQGKPNLSGVEQTYFNELLQLSPIPVDKSHVESVKERFKECLEDGISGDVLVEALKDYNEYSKNAQAENPAYRPLYLAAFLKKNAAGQYHKSIQFVMNKRQNPESKAYYSNQPATPTKLEMKAPELMKATSGMDEGRWCYLDTYGFHFVDVDKNATEEEARAAMMAEANTKRGSFLVR